MKSLRFFLVLLLVWLGTQIVIWSWSEFILKGSQLERMLGLEDAEPYLSPLAVDCRCTNHASNSEKGQHITRTTATSSLALVGPYRFTTLQCP